MSYDFALEVACPHRVLFEVVQLDSVYQQTIRFQRPPFSQNVTLYINGQDVPQTGLFSVASLPLSNPAPYRIVQGQSDMIYFQIGQQMPMFVQLNSGTSISAASLARDLGQKLPGLNITVNNNHVVISTFAPIQGQAFTFVDPRWTDKTSSLPTTARILGGYNSLGIIPGRVVSGYQLFPSWKLVKDPQSPIDTDRIIQLTTPLRNAQPIIQANYQTTAAQCRRCFGVRIEFDYTIVNNTYDTVQNADLLAQEFDKFLFTTIGSHWKWPWIGSNLINRVGGKGSTALSNVSALLTSDIASAFATYQDVKLQQSTGYIFQQVTDAEYPAALQNISAQQAQNDPTTFIITASIISRSTTPITLTRVVGLPNPVSVLSNNPSGNLLMSSNNGFLLRG